jgi:hypothetical protein
MVNMNIGLDVDNYTNKWVEYLRTLQSDNSSYTKLELVKCHWHESRNKHWTYSICGLTDASSFTCYIEQQLNCREHVKTTFNLCVQLTHYLSHSNRHWIWSGYWGKHKTIVFLRMHNLNYAF